MADEKQGAGRIDKEVESQPEPVKLKALNPRTQALEDYDLTIDRNGEWLLKNPDGSFIKYPANLTKAKLLKQIKKDSLANQGQIPQDDEEVAAANQAKLETFRDVDQSDLEAELEAAKEPVEEGEVVEE